MPDSSQNNNHTVLTQDTSPQLAFELLKDKDEGHPISVHSTDILVFSRHSKTVSEMSVSEMYV